MPTPPITSPPPWPPLPGLAGRTALVTGGSRGPGAATCRALAASGARVAVTGRDRAALDAVVAAIRAEGGDAHAFPADVTEPLGDLRAAVAERYGSVDVLCPFAGGQGRPEPSAALGLDRWREVLETDLTSVFATVTAFLPDMVERGAGSVVLMSSAAARQPGGANAAYAAAKAGVVMLGKHLARELGPAGIRVNCLAPSAVENERLRAALDERQRAGLAAAFPLGRLGRDEDVAQAALWLASDAASWVTGVTLDLSGGRVIV
ncbi:SDR family NAD(P)-dependent oxidoreductase [Streptomyces sp. NPDC049879]|uniref:SDR family NAD(P)-dependent oxidoreductase n=1 Tax=Streptomyces sp. NPDC049879 TaxID=3365598 RepID=UPI00378FC7BF